jgi:Skp family chaperone for outer membrane proteins
MKNFVKFQLAALMLIAFASPAFAQKYAFVNTEYILDNIPEYKAALQRD